MLEEKKPLKVYELTKYIKELFDTIPIFQSIEIEGEISNFVYNQSGHIYFTLKDSLSQISCVMFKTYADKLVKIPKDGDKVVLKGSVQVYEKSGRYQFYCLSIKESGIGDLYIKFEELKKKLFNEGLFDENHKKKFPKFPKNIALLTSRTGAVIEDLKSIILSRSRFSNLTLYPTKVQGEDAKYSIIDNIKKANQNPDIDCIILARGGGSIEDLWPFNEEEVAYAIYNSIKPIMSAVGHETDFTISDFVSDMRAATPSDAALRIVRDNKDLKNELDSLTIRLGNKDNLLLRFKNDLVNISTKLDSYSPKNKLNKEKESYVNLINRLNNSYKLSLNTNISSYKLLNEKLIILNPLNVLDKGYSLTYKDDVIIKSSTELKKHDVIKTRFKNGEVISEVLEVK